MDLSVEIKTVYEKFVKDTFKKEDIKGFFLNHERKELFHTNLLKQMKMAYHLLQNTTATRKIIKEMSAIFCKAALEKKEMELSKAFKPTIVKSESDDEC